MQTSRGIVMEDGQTPFTSWVKTNASTANLLSIIMLIFAAWAAVEIVTNVTGSEVPPVTGMETNDDPNDTQRVNNGAIIGLGAVAGTLGIILQLMIPRNGSSETDDSTPREDEEIDEVVDVMMDDIESDDDDEGSEEESFDEEESEELTASEGEGSIEEEEEVPENEGGDSSEDDVPAEEEKPPAKKRKF